MTLNYKRILVKFSFLFLIYKGRNSDIHVGDTIQRSSTDSDFGFTVDTSTYFLDWVLDVSFIVLHPFLSTFKRLRITIIRYDNLFKLVYV